jgi:Syntaxin-5 N-terminal, Sly1p-binding domain
MGSEFQSILDEFNKRRTALMENGAIQPSAWDGLLVWSMQAILEALRRRDEADADSP